MQQYWINQEGVQKGPFSIDELQAMTLGEDTYVWYSGMSDWQKMGEIEELKHLISHEAPQEEITEVQPVEEIVAVEEETGEPTPEAPVEQEAQPPVQDVVSTDDEQVSQPPIYVENVQETTSPPPQYEEKAYTPMPQPAQQEMPQCPPSNLVWSIICTILCCTPLGVISIVFSALVKSKYNAGDYLKAKKYSDLSAWLCIASIVLGLVSLPFAFLSIMF